MAVVAVGRASLIPTLITRARAQSSGSFVVRSPQTNVARAYIHVRATRGTITNEQGTQIGTVEATANIVSFYNLRGVRTGYAVLNESTGTLRFHDLETGGPQEVGTETVAELSVLVQEISESNAPSVVVPSIADDDEEEDEAPVGPTLNQRYPSLPSVEWRFVNGDSKCLERDKAMTVLENDRGPKDLNSFVAWLTESSGWNTDTSFTNDPEQHVQINDDGTGAIFSGRTVEHFTWEPAIVLERSTDYHHLVARTIIKAADGKVGYGYITYQTEQRANFYRPPIDRSLPSWHPAVQATRDNEMRSGQKRPEQPERPAPPQPQKKGFFSRLFGR